MTRGPHPTGSSAARLARGLREFVDPRLKAGRIPLGRTTVVLLLVGALTFVGYTLAKKNVRLPWQADPYLVDVIVPDAKGLDPAKEPAAGVAGAKVGRVVAVRHENGRARVTLSLEPELRGRIFANATASIRPTSVLQTLMVNVLPGDPAAGPLPDRKPIPPERTDAFVHIDELTSVLDADTQAQTQVLITEAARALRGRAPELRRILAELGALTDGATPLAKALADRRRLVTKLVGHLDRLFGTLGRRGTQLARAVRLGNRTLAVTAARAPQLERATRALGPALSEARRGLAAARRLAGPLNSALAELLPVAPELGSLGGSLKAFAPKLDELVADASTLVEDGARPARLFAAGLRGLPARLRADQIPALRELVELVELIHHYRFGLIQFGETWSGALSANRRAGTYTQLALVGSEMTPEGLGLAPRAARNAGAGPSRMSKLVAEALERACRDNAAACLVRFNHPDLPAQPVSVGGGGR